LFSNFWAAVSAFALLSCSNVHVAALFLYWFIEQINDDDDDEICTANNGFCSCTVFDLNSSDEAVYT